MPNYAIRAFGSTVPYYRINTGKAIASINSFKYIINGITLDAVYMATLPILNGGCVIGGQSFMLLWEFASVTTKNAMSNSSTGSMTFEVHDGSSITAPVSVVSVIVKSMLLATLTVTATTPINKRTISTQFY